MAHGEALIAGNTAFSEQLNTMDRAVTAVQDKWQGEAATAASARALAEGLSGTHISTAVIALAEAHTEGGKALSDIKTTLLQVQADAVVSGMSVAGDGTCTAPTFPAAAAGGVLAMLMQIDLDEKAAWFTARLKELLARAAATEALTTAAIAEAHGDLTELRENPSGGPTSSTVSDIINGTTSLPEDPTRLHNLWELLSPAEKDALFEWDPMIGNRDGIPQTDRDHYNRENLEQLQENAQQRLDALNGAHPQWAQGDVPTSRFRNNEYADYEPWQEETDHLETQIAGYKQVASQLQPTGPEAEPRFLSVLDDQGHAAIALGNPDTADAVATYVPGTTANMTNIDDGVERAQKMQEDAAILAPGQATSVVAWYGYDAPQDVVTEAGQSEFADTAEGPLTGFQDGLRVTHDGAPSSNTVIGHSYGTTAIGHAASDGNTLNADQIVFVASPGVGVDDVSDLSLTGVDPDDNGEHVYAITNLYDPIRMTPPFVHDIQPVNPDFGAQIVGADTSRGPWYTGFVDLDGGHGTYWDRANPALRNMSRIITGVGGPPS